MLVCGRGLWSEKGAESTEGASVAGQSGINAGPVESSEKIVAYIDGERL